MPELGRPERLQLDATRFIESGCRDISGPRGELHQLV
jgi:hypothetical protein